MGNDIAGVGVNFETDWLCYSRAINTFPGVKPYFNKIVSETKSIFVYNACIIRNQCICCNIGSDIIGTDNGLSPNLRQATIMMTSSKGKKVSASPALCAENSPVTGVCPT